MQKLTWVIDKEILNGPNVVGNFAEAIINAGHDVYMSQYIPFASPEELDYGNFDHWDMPLTVYGTIGFVKKSPAHLYKYGFNENTDCNYYYANLPGEWMLNRYFIMVPFGVFRQNAQMYFEMFETQDLFIRPNSGKKSFTGFVVNYFNVEQELSSSMQLTSVTNETICLVSCAQQIDGEFRFLIGNKEVIDGSEYRWDNILDVRHDWPKECWEMADKMARHEWQPDLIYCVDVALTNVGPKIIELNSFSSAGLYAMDKNIVANRVSEVILKDFNGEIE